MALYQVKNSTLWNGTPWTGNLLTLSEGTTYATYETVSVVSHYSLNGQSYSHAVSFTQLPVFLGFYDNSGPIDLSSMSCQVIVTTSSGANYVSVKFDYTNIIPYPGGFNSTLFSVPRGSSDKVVPSMVIESMGFYNFDSISNQAFNYIPQRFSPVYAKWQWETKESVTNNISAVYATQEITFDSFSGYEQLDIRALGYV